MKLSIQIIKSSLVDLAEKIDAPRNLLPPINDIQEGFSIELDEFNNLYYIMAERGSIERDLMMDLEDLLYNAFKNITGHMAMAYELKNRTGDQDSRRISFQREEELMRKLNEEWGRRIEKDHEYILRYAPFRDLISK
jgi:hypothetical protein